MRNNKTNSIDSSHRVYLPPTHPLLLNSSKQSNARTATGLVTGEETTGAPLKNAKPSSHQETASTTGPLPPPPHPPRPPQTTETDVTQEEREAQISATMLKFEDIHKVYKECDNFPVDLAKFDENTNVKSRLSLPESVEFFRKIGASQFIIDTLQNGHHPTLTGPVPTYEIENHGSFRKHIDFATDDILKLIAKGRVEIVDKKPLLINPLHVVVQRTKKRLILDCSTLNKFIRVPKIKYDNHEIGLQYFKKGCFMFSYDLKDGYHHLSIHESFRDYLGFKLVLNGKLTYCRYVVGCFGLADLPWIFTKVYRPLVAHWRSNGIPAVKFLDDGGFFCKDLDSARENSLHVKKDLIRSGSIFSPKKCIWEPVQKMQWLGLVWDSIDGSIAAAPHRIEKIVSTCASLLVKDNCTIRDLAAFVGMIVSLMPVVGNCSRVTTKCSQICIAGARSWDDTTHISLPIKREILFWKDNVEKLNYRRVADQGPPKVFNIIEGDASSTGLGSILNREHLAARIFSNEEKETHSTYRELSNIHYSLLAFLPRIKNSSVKFLVDSQSAARIVDSGSMKEELQWFATEIFHICFRNNISFRAEWIPRTQNTLADWASREADLIDIEDWQITTNFFTILNSRHGPFTLDAFSNSYNNKCPRFYSLFHSPGCLGVDALTYDWKGENVLLVPPVNAIGQALAHLRICKAKGVLVAPKWPSSYFWPLLRNEFSPFISEINVFKGKNVLCHGHNKNSILGSPDFEGEVISVALDCSL